MASSLFFTKKGCKHRTLRQQKHLWLQKDIENPIFVIDTPEISAITIQNALSVNTSKKEKAAEMLVF